MKKLILKWMRYLRDEDPSFWDVHCVSGCRSIVVCNLWDWCAGRADWKWVVLGLKESIHDFVSKEK